MSEEYSRERPVNCAPQRQGIGLAVASLICGILSCFCCGLLGFPAIVVGHCALRSIRQGNLPADARGYAVAGLVLGYVSLALFMLMAAVSLVLAAIMILSGSAAEVSPFVYAL